MIDKIDYYELKSKQMRDEIIKAKFENIRVYGNNVGIKRVRFIDVLTGEGSKNKTHSRHEVYNADIGLVCEFKDKLYFFFGDTSLAFQPHHFINNVLAYTSKYDYENGIELDGYLKDDNGHIREIISGEMAVPNYDNIKFGREMTKIPNGAVVIGDTLYMTFMSVACFTLYGDPDNWNCNYGGLIKSKDMVNFTKTDFRTDKDSHFLQNYMVKLDGYVYMFGLRGGRYNGCALMRTKEQNIEELSTYEYLTGYDNNNAVWGKQGDSIEIIKERVWEHCIVYNKYLKKWMLSFTGFTGSSIYTADNIAGPYNLSYFIPKPKEIDMGWYCCYTHEKLMKEDGKKVCFLISYMAVTYPYPDKPDVYDNNWQVCQVEVEFE